MKAISLHFQRNGVAGIGFYQFHYTDNPDKDKKRTFLATFTTLSDEISIDWTSCRVSSLEDLSLAWRGDRIADTIEDYLFKTFGKPKRCLYDLIELINKK
jgi:hypothetical protein